MKAIRITMAILFMAMLAGSAQAKVLWENDWKNWRDQDTNPGFDATLEVNEKKNIGIARTDEETSYGKVMSPEEGINITIDKDTTITLELLVDIPEGDIKVNLMTAAEPYDGHTVIDATDKKGIYKAKIAKKTPWTGKHTFWVAIWVEGFDRVAKIGRIQITDGKKITKRTTTKKKKVVRKKKSSRKKSK